jgi:hypothetical protein
MRVFFSARRFCYERFEKAHDLGRALWLCFVSRQGK